MSFSSDIKDEISRISGQNEKTAVSELFAVFASVGLMGLSSAGVRLKASFENRAAAKRVSMLLEKHFGIVCGISVKDSNLNSKKIYSITADGRDTVFSLLKKLGFPEGNLFLSSAPPDSITDTEEKTSAFLRGLMLSCGVVVHPKKNYSAEFVFLSEQFAVCVLKILKKLGLNAKIVLRKSDHVVYLRGGDDVAALLSLIGATSALLDFENIRAFRDIRNNVNRAANFEAANFTKTYGAAQKFLKIIDIIDNGVGLSSLSPALREAAELRIAYPESSLSELAEIANVSKSALNHRMRKLKQLAEEIKEEMI